MEDEWGQQLGKVPVYLHESQNRPHGELKRLQNEQTKRRAVDQHTDRATVSTDAISHSSLLLTALQSYKFHLDDSQTHRSWNPFMTHGEADLTH